MNSYKDLLVWKKGFDLTIKVYELTALFPKSKEYCQFLRIAYASAAELETELLIAQKLNYGKTELYPQLFSLLEEISKMLFVLNKKISQS